MNKFSLMFVLSLLFSNAFSQKNIEDAIRFDTDEIERRENETMKVMGINIKTTMKEFKPQINAKGGEILKSPEGEYEYKVNFAGYQGCTMKVEFNTDNDSITAVNVFFPHESFKSDEILYGEMKRQFREKYGHARETDLTQFGRPNKWCSYGKMGQYTVFWLWDDKKCVYVRYETRVKRHPNKSYSSDI